MKKETVILVFALMILPLAFVNAQSGQTNPFFSVSVLKYDPSPVNSGDWFDLWVKVQNIGQDDAKNAQFTLVPEYPFSSNDSLVRDYGLIAGTVNAYRTGFETDASQIILKYRVYVANNAPNGTSNLKLLSRADSKDPSSAIFENDLPIVIGKTKSDFDVSMESITPQGVSFIVTNIGQNLASSIVLSAPKQNGVSFISNSPSSIGDLDKGEFTIGHLQIIPQNIDNMIIDVSYTDTSGTRTTIEKSVSVKTASALDQVCQYNPNKAYINWIYAIVGLFVGIAATVLFRIIRRK